MNLNDDDEKHLSFKGTGRYIKQDYSYTTFGFTSKTFHFKKGEDINDFPSDKLNAYLKSISPTGTNPYA